ncbi:MAG: peptide chain release factor N(5)-glutamine methyltransferase [Thermodesulfobacteriota bacterium]
MPRLQSKPHKSWTIQQALNWADEYLQAEGLPDPHLSAELLLGSVLGLDRLGLIVHFDQSIDEPEWAFFQERVLRRAGQEPIAYLLGQKEFWSLNFEVNPDVLIPRPETELLVEESLKILSDRTGLKTLVELGTGSGAVSIVLAKSAEHLETTQCLATDISWEALRTAQKNVFNHKVEKKLHLVQGDWLGPFSSRERWIDLLISNPPYVSDHEMDNLPMTVKRYEPLKALAGGQDGLEAIRHIFQQASKQLKVGGWLLLEIGETQGDQVVKLARGHHFNPTTIRRDYAGRDRVLKACYHG